MAIRVGVLAQNNHVFANKLSVSITKRQSAFLGHVN
jgi:hypothetical protein